ncbi:MAG: cobalamin B12-binding domain-containing protein [Nitrospinae bacterium]|nr:cobalamin B12-binding domain-containing protein [Nitrospinota bacterium]
MCADAVYARLEILRPNIAGAPAVSVRGEVIIGAIEGDIHDFGKNLVKMVFEIAGFTVHDLGSDVPIRKFVKTAQSTGAPLTLVSVMMSPCLPRARELVEELHKKAPGARVMIGGCAVDAGAVERLGGDGTAKDAHHALREAIRLLSAARRMNDPHDENRALL